MDADVHARGNDVVARSFGILENMLVQHAVFARAQHNVGVFPLYACTPDTSKETNIIWHLTDGKVPVHNNHGHPQRGGSK